MRYLLNTLPSSLFILSIMLGLTCLSLIFFFVVRRYFPKLLTDTMSPAFSVMGTSYGFLLGFSIAILWQNYTAASNVTAAEAGNFGLLLNDLQILSQDAQLKLLKGLVDYISLVKNQEWEAMKWGESASIATDAIRDLTLVMKTIEPVGTVEHLAYSDIYKELGNILQNRAARIQAIDTILPYGVKILLIIGATFIIFSVAVNDTKNRINHLISMIMVSFLLAFNLGLAFILAYPFSGDNHIPGRALIEVIPVRLKLLQKQLKEAQQAAQVENNKVSKP